MNRRLRVSAHVSFNLTTIVDLTDDMSVTDVEYVVRENFNEQMQTMLDRKQFVVSNHDIEYEEIR